MKKLKIIMGMPVTVEVVDQSATKADIDEVFNFFKYVDQKFSTYREDSEITLINKRIFPATFGLKSHSEISAINNGQIKIKDSSADMKLVFKLAKQTKKETDGFFDIYQGQKIDPSGLVKGWAIWQASKLLKKKGFKNFYIDAGGDIQSYGKNKDGQPWQIGIRNPFKISEVVKVVRPKNKGIATSGTYERGYHIYNPKTGQNVASDIVSLTVIGPNIYEADRFATAAFSMGEQGIHFIEKLPGFEGYQINKAGIATYTSGFEAYTIRIDFVSSAKG